MKLTISISVNVKDSCTVMDYVTTKVCSIQHSQYRSTWPNNALIPAYDVFKIKTVWSNDILYHIQNILIIILLLQDLPKTKDFPPFLPTFNTFFVLFHINVIPVILLSISHNSRWFILENYFHLWNSIHRLYNTFPYYCIFTRSHFSPNYSLRAHPSRFPLSSPK